MSVPVTRAKDGEAKATVLWMILPLWGVKACPLSWAISEPLLFKSQGF